MWLCQILFVPSMCFPSFLFLTSIVFYSEFINFGFSDKIAKLNSQLLKIEAIYSIKKKRKQEGRFSAY